MNNLDIYEKYRSVPKEAQKTIEAGRLKGYTDINPMWRLKSLTEAFGMCGIGWYYDVIRTWIDEVGNERVANVEINLYVKVDGEWSKPIVGTGGSKLSTTEKNGVYVSDECYKMATTDAISVACKQLGFGADIYWSKDRTKYSAPEEPKKQSIPLKTINAEQFEELKAEAKRTGKSLKAVINAYGFEGATQITEDAFIQIMKNFKDLPTKEITAEDALFG